MHLKNIVHLLQVNTPFFTVSSPSPKQQRIQSAWNDPMFQVNSNKKEIAWNVSISVQRYWTIASESPETFFTEW